MLQHSQTDLPLQWPLHRDEDSTYRTTWLDKAEGIWWCDEEYDECIEISTTSPMPKDLWTEGKIIRSLEDQYACQIKWDCYIRGVETWVKLGSLHQPHTSDDTNLSDDDRTKYRK